MEEPDHIESITIVFRSQQLPQIDIEICQSNDKVIGQFKLLNNTSNIIMLEKDIDDCYVSASNREFAIENHFYIKIENIAADHKGHYKLVKKYDKFELNVEIMLKGGYKGKQHMFDEDTEVDAGMLAHKTLMKINEKLIKEHQAEELRKEMVLAKKLNKKCKIKGSVGSRYSNKKNGRPVSLAHSHFSRNQSGEGSGEGYGSGFGKNNSKLSNLCNLKRGTKHQLKTNKTLRFQVTQNEKSYQSNHQFKDEYCSLRVKKSSTSYQSSCAAPAGQTMQKAHILQSQQQIESLERQSQVQSFYGSRLRKIQQAIAQKEVKMNQITSKPAYKNRLMHLQQITAIQLKEQQKILQILNQGKENKMFSKNISKLSTNMHSKNTSKHTQFPSPYSLKLSAYFKSNRYCLF